MGRGTIAGVVWRPLFQEFGGCSPLHPFRVPLPHKGMGEDQTHVAFAEENRAKKLSMGFSTLKRRIMTYCWAIVITLLQVQ